MEFFMEPTISWTRQQSREQIILFEVHTFPAAIARRQLINAPGSAAPLCVKMAASDTI